MSAVMESYQSQPPFQLPHRKPLPPGVSTSRPQSMARFYPEQQQLAAAQQNSQSQPGTQYTTRSRPPSSSSLVGLTQIPQNTNPVSYQAHMNQYNPTTKRTLSNATTSTTSTGGATKVNPSSASTLQRSTSARSNTSTSYVALMRKQKATVWCERAQQEDPRLLAQQRAAKMRAAMEVSNANAAGRSSTSGSSGMIRSKIRHHGAPKAQQYTPNTHPASGVPMRLSANEVDEEESEEENSSGNRAGYHQRSGSGRSSVGSGRVSSLYMTQTAGPTTGSTPSSGHAMSPVDARSPEETPVPEQRQRGPDYFAAAGGKGGSAGSDDSEELNFGGIGGLPRRVKGPNEEEARKMDLADLRRRGSVDERTMTMSGYGRLYVANPDV